MVGRTFVTDADCPVEEAGIGLDTLRELLDGRAFDLELQGIAVFVLGVLGDLEQRRSQTVTDIPFVIEQDRELSPPAVHREGFPLVPEAGRGVVFPGPVRRGYRDDGMTPDDMLAHDDVIMECHAGNVTLYVFCRDDLCGVSFNSSDCV